MLVDPTRLHGGYLVCGRTNLRRGIDGLAAVIDEQYQINPRNQALYLFCRRRKDRFKALFWDGAALFCYTSVLRMATFSGSLIKIR